MERKKKEEVSRKQYIYIFLKSKQKSKPTNKQKKPLVTILFSKFAAVSTTRTSPRGETAIPVTALKTAFVPMPSMLIPPPAPQPAIDTTPPIATFSTDI